MEVQEKARESESAILPIDRGIGDSISLHPNLLPA
jgi:hypothetical protein